jgi:hypothetical protein
VVAGRMNVLLDNSRHPMFLAMIDEIATRRYAVAPDIQSLFQWQ